MTKCGHASNSVLASASLAGSPACASTATLAHAGTSFHPAASQPSAGQLAGLLLSPPDSEGSADSFDWRGYFHARHKAALERMNASQKQPVVTIGKPYVPPPRKRFPTIVYRDPIGPMPLPAKWHPFATKVAIEVCVRRRVWVHEVMGPSRVRRIADARQEIMWRLRNGQVELSFPQITRWMGGYDHSTIHNGVKKHQRRIDSGEVAA